MSATSQRYGTAAPTEKPEGVAQEVAEPPNGGSATGVLAGSLAQLAPSARKATPRTRAAVGAAVVLFVIAVAVASILSFMASGAGNRELILADSPKDRGGTHSNSTAQRKRDGESAAPPGEAMLLVHVMGAVTKPGLVQLNGGARVIDAVAAAGGFAVDADQSSINLARAVTDGEQLNVPVIGAGGQSEAAAATGAQAGGGSAAVPGDGKIHLNTADLVALDGLPRIGPALAQRIIDWRQTNGPFSTVDQLKEVSGIGEAVFAGLVDKVAL